MSLLEYTFSEKKVQYFLDASFAEIDKLLPDCRIIIITDENVSGLYPELNRFSCIIIPAGEQHKNQFTVDDIIQQLITYGADRTTFIVGVGGGVVTDIAGFAASVYMRGLRFGFVPTTVLAQVDASIGGKNGIDAGLYKNLVGLIRQPEFILFDHSLLNTLPREQWVNGFAEIIKHACIKDKNLFAFLENHQLEDFRNNKALLADLIKKNVIIKSEIVKQDEFESGDRKLLNFGHTIGHAIENLYQLPHGHAVSIGITAACALSEELNFLPVTEKQSIISLLKQYGLPTSISVEGNSIFQMLTMDKKRVSSDINFVLLNGIGKAMIKPVSLKKLEELIKKEYMKEVRI